MTFYRTLACLALAAALAVSAFSTPWDYDAEVQIELRDWRYLSLAEPSERPPAIAHGQLAVVTLPWTVERTRPMAWFQTSVEIPEAWKGLDVLLHVETRGPVRVLADGADLASLNAPGLATLTARLPQSANAQPINLAIGCATGETAAVLDRVWLESEPAGLSTAVAAINRSLDVMDDYSEPINPWKRVIADSDGAHQTHFDDSAWETVRVGDEWRGDDTPAWYRARLTVPYEVAGVPLRDEMPLLALDFDDPARCYVNGKEVEPLAKDFRGSLFALPAGTKPGDEIDVAFRILNRWGSGKLRQAAWRLASIDEGFHLKRDLKLEVNRLARTIRAHDLPQFGWVDALSRLNAPLSTARADLTRFSPTLQEARAAFDALLAEVAADPVLLVPPYLQDARPNQITICFETSAPVPALVDFGVGALDRGAAETESQSTIHKITLTGLTPATTYTYAVTAGRRQTAPRTFITAPEGPAPFEFLVWGDNQSGVRMARHVTRAMAADSADFVMSVGDVVDRGINWDEWTLQYLLPARVFMGDRPSYIAMGNHEYGGYEGNPNVVAFDHYFKHPDTSPGSNHYWYAFTWANARFVVLEPLKMKWMPHPDPARGNTIVPDDPQLLWLDRELAANAGKHDWTFVFYHEPAFLETWSGGYHDGEDFLRNAVVPILEQHKVDMVFNGHTHAYERGLPHPEWDPVTQLGNGITYIITGGGGGGLDNHKYAEWDKIDIPDHPADPDSNEPDEGEFYRHHYCHISVDGKSLTFTAREVLENGRPGKVLDNFKLQK
ncbi:MAG: metallophosphoesterase family protein [Candidatus Hydrogenedentes bacterium]|nr:metallophosphoesterase family protein [Candidatus Hydrogenedentota bacterium]